VNRLVQTFADLRARGRKGLIPYLCGGHPRPGDTARALVELQLAGATAIEVGIPFSDPIADGPVIAEAMHTALTRGSTPQSVFDEVTQARRELAIPLIAMVSVSIVYRAAAGKDSWRGEGGKGLRWFIEKARDAGFDGFIFPDATLEESTELASACAAADMTAALLIAPTTPAERAEKIAQASTGFIYMLARGGITGERQDAPDVGPRVAQLRKATQTPIAVGFGISSPEHVRAVVQHADAAIVGSAIVRRMTEADQKKQDPVRAAADFTRQLAQGLEA
jgi:tryptophan synthase alpha chain